MAMLSRVHGIGRLRAGKIGAIVVAITKFVDSVLGLDTNNGLTSATAKKTLGGVGTLATSDVLGLAKGSTWTEEMDILTSNVSVTTYGSGNVPLIDCADTATGWTQYDATNYPNVWTLSWTRAWTPSSEELMYAWANGSLISRFASSIADLNSNGGWYADSRAALTTNVYIYSTTNPNTSGVLYELPRRAHGINNHPVSTGGTQTGMQMQGPIEARRGVGHYGGITTTTGDTSKLLLRFGGIHHIVTQADTASDIICSEMPIGFGQEYIPYTAYAQNGTGRTHTAKRIMVIGDTDYTNNGGIYTHGSTAPFDSATFEQCAIVTANKGIGATVTNGITVRGIYTNSVEQPVLLNTGSSCAVSYGQFREMPGPVGTGLIDAGPVDSTNRTRLIEHCVFYAGGTNWPNIKVQQRSGSVEVRNCIFVVPGTNTAAVYISQSAAMNINVHHCIFICTGAPSLFNAVYVDSTGGTLTMDYNAYCYPSGNSSAFNFSDAGGFYTTLAAWQAHTGQDAHSISVYSRPTLLTDLFSGSIANGDFRLKTTHGITFSDGQSLNIAGPQMHWDWNARAAVSGPPTAWPTLPATTADMRAYISNPSGWTF